MGQGNRFLMELVEGYICVSVEAGDPWKRWSWELMLEDSGS